MTSGLQGAGLQPQPSNFNFLSCNILVNIFTFSRHRQAPKSQPLAAAAQESANSVNE